MDVQAETEVHPLLCAPGLSDSASRPIHPASSTAFSKVYRNVLSADVPVALNLPEFY